MSDHLKNLSQVYLEQIAESAVPGKPAEKLELDENRRAARAAGGYKDDSKKQTDPSKAGFTGISGSIKDIMRKNKEIEARNKAKSKTEALDPVGKEDADVDNDGKKNDSNDKYIMKRREAIRKAIAAKKKVSEQLGEELVIEVSGEEKEVKIKEKKVNNKITINPELKESISEIGGEVLFISEVDEVDSIAESVHIELIEEGYSEEQVVEAIKYAIDEVTSPAKVASFKMKKAKYTPKPETKEEPKKSLKDRIKSIAKKALDKASETAGKIMKKKAEIQAAPAKAKKKLGSYVDRAKAVAKAGYERGRGPVEKKPTTYRGAGAGRREKIGEEVATDPKMQQLQKKQIMLDRQKLSARVQAMQKKKPAPEQAQEEMSIADQMRISREAAAKRKPYQPGDREKQRAAQMRNAAKKTKKDTRTDAERMSDATGPRDAFGRPAKSGYRGD